MLGNGDVNFLLFTRDPAFLARRKPEETSSEEIPQSLRGGVLYDTYLVHSKDGADERWYFNPETGMLDLIEGASRRSQFALRFSNYRNIGVFTMPLDVQFYSRGRVVFSVHRLEVQRGARLSPPLFYATPWDLEDGKRAEAALHKYLQDSIFSGGGRRAMFIRESIATSASGETAERSITFEPPSRIFIDTDTKGIGHERAGFDGSVGWTDSELQGYHVLKDSEIQLLFSVMTISATRRSRRTPPCGTSSGRERCSASRRSRSSSPRSPSPSARSILTRTTGISSGSPRKSALAQA
jgi:hypothetical protein